MNRLPAPWVFVTTGILFNILSAVITHYFIGLNNDQIIDIDRGIQSKQVLIDSLWQSKTEVERKKEFFILLLAMQNDQQSSHTELIDRYYRDYVLETAKTYNLPGFENKLITSMRDPDLLLQLSEAAQTNIIESINSTYFERIELEDEKTPLERANARLFSIAIFLQVIGLILVLARDLKRA